MSLKLEERNQQTLNNIKQLQNVELNYYNELNKVDISENEKNNIVNKINEISQTRINLYNTLKNTYASYNDNINMSRSTIGEQMVAVDIIENQLNDMKKKLQILQNEKINKLRLVGVNTYYSKRYTAHTYIMKIIVLLSIIILIISILSNRGLLPRNVQYFLLGIIVILGVYLIGKQVIDLYYRSNINFDEYEWYFNKSDAPKPSTYTTTSTDSSSSTTESTNTCTGQACCYEGTTYYSDVNMCMSETDYNNYISSLSSSTNISDTTNTSNTSNTSNNNMDNNKALELYGYKINKFLNP